PASFKVVNSEKIEADFGQKAIGRVTPIDSGLWWIFMLYAYEKACDRLLVAEEKIAHRDEFQRGIKLILELCLTARFDMNPTMLVPEGSFMIDRRMGVYGHPLEIQSLFHIALRAGKELLKPEIRAELNIENRLTKLTKFIRQHYWIDPIILRGFYRYQTEEFGESALNQFNIDVNSLPEWVLHCLDRNGGYLVGNVGVSWIDFRFFTQGNLLAILSGLILRKQSEQIINLIENRRDELIGEMPIKICYPAVEGRDWELITGCDRKNIPWSYHNGGNWPVLIWPLVAACQKVGKTNLAQDAIEIAEKYLYKDCWPEYYDGIDGKLIGRQSRLYQTWTIAGYLVAKYLMETPENLGLINFD
ncbi:MAG: alkaline invertase, partial [Okeania sp. SIO2H7]|nr:alkaline invertase [Okeania sp. SIO2H7]